MQSDINNYKNNYKNTSAETYNLLFNSNPEILNMLNTDNKIKWINEHGTKRDISNIYKSDILYNIIARNKNIFEVDKLKYKNDMLLINFRFSIF